jgi:hypothetical protein
MVINANAGPYVGFGITRGSTGGVSQYNEERGPSMFDLGSGMMDTRAAYAYQPGDAVGSPTLMLYNSEGFVDYQPTTASSNGIISNSQPTASGGITITASGAGVIATTIVAPESNITVSVWALDSTAAYLPFGQAGTICAWNPAAGAGRTIIVGTSSNLDGGSFTVAGRDMYGIKMTEQITVGGATSFTGKKAFKYISAVAASSTITSTGVTVGYTDTFGFPVRLNYCGYNSVVNLLATSFSSAVTVALSSANTVLASTVATQTSTTPDVRGTYASTTASNGTLRVQLFQAVTANQVAGVTNIDHTSVFGGTQFSSV